MPHTFKTIIGVIVVATLVGITRMEIFRIDLMAAIIQPLLDRSLGPLLETWFMVIVTVVAYGIYLHSALIMKALITIQDRILRQPLQPFLTMPLHQPPHGFPSQVPTLIPHLTNPTLTPPSFIVALTRFMLVMLD